MTWCDIVRNYICDLKSPAAVIFPAPGIGTAEGEQKQIMPIRNQ